MSRGGSLPILQPQSADSFSQPDARGQSADTPLLRSYTRALFGEHSHTLPLHSYVIELLKDWKEKHPDAKRNDRIVKVPASNSSFLKVLNPDLEYAGIEKMDDVGRVVHLHVLRHSFASLLARQGVHPHVLQRLARHADIQTTMSVYTHLLHGDDVSAIESLKQPKKAVKNNKRNRAVG